MWYGLRMSSKVDPDLVSITNELLQSTLRTLVLAMGGICTAWYIVANITTWHTMMIEVSCVLLVVAVSSVVALRLSSRRLLVAQLVWLSGLAAAVTLAAHLFQR
jgi:uncharacterized membrane protein